MYANSCDHLKFKAEQIWVSWDRIVKTRNSNVCQSAITILCNVVKQTSTYKHPQTRNIKCVKCVLPQHGPNVKYASVVSVLLLSTKTTQEGSYIVLIDQYQGNLYLKCWMWSSRSDPEQLCAQKPRLLEVNTCDGTTCQMGESLQKQGTTWENAPVQICKFKLLLKIHEQMKHQDIVSDVSMSRAPCYESSSYVCSYKHMLCGLASLCVFEHVCQSLGGMNYAALSNSMLINHMMHMPASLSQIPDQTNAQWARWCEGSTPRYGNGPWKHCDSTHHGCCMTCLSFLKWWKTKRAA